MNMMDTTLYPEIILV